MYYLVSYDLRSPGKNYTRLIEALKSFEDWWHGLDSVWIVFYSGSAIDLTRYLKQFLDRNDQLVAVEIARDWASLNISDECSQWLRSRLSPGGFPGLH